MKEIRDEIIEEKELDEVKIKVLVDYTSIVKDMRIVPNKTKFGVRYNVNITLYGVDGIKTKCDEEFVRLIKTYANFGKVAVVKKELVKEESEEGKTYLCAKFTLINGKVFRYFIGRADEDTIDIVYQDYLEKNKKKGE